MILQSAQEIVLGLFGRDIQANAGRDELGQNLAQLPEFEQGGIGIIGKISLCKHAKAHEFRFVRL